MNYVEQLHPLDLGRRQKVIIKRLRELGHPEAVPDGFEFLSGPAANVELRRLEAYAAEQQAKQEAEREKKDAARQAANRERAAAEARTPLAIAGALVQQLHELHGAVKRFQWITDDLFKAIVPAELLAPIEPLDESGLKIPADPAHLDEFIERRRGDLDRVEARLSALQCFDLRGLPPDEQLRKAVLMLGQRIARMEVRAGAPA